eukprot:TRINITY_DN92738_c0_g1_i1.p1 TRINITY_DN92738_c0_g1~~TRINITY_DN92738_c0_g1_i1.p1  ORF type:complete len:408 (-),score=117.24 TRINITY_DN92738_c0_g1_i1:109-1332(-)
MAEETGYPPEGTNEATPGGEEAAAPAEDTIKQEQKTDDRLIKVKGLDKQQLCIDLLMVGCVQSFVDFFYITHRKTAPTEQNPDVEVKDVPIPEETLVFLKETLEQAESARRARSYLQCFESYNSLAEYFEKVPDLKSAMYFYQRCVDVAAEVDAWESISKANLCLGSCEEQAGNWQSAMQYHEKALQIAQSADSLPLQIKAASRLTLVCQVLAEQCEKESRDSDATALYERCLNCAQLSKDDTLEGTACHKLGLSKHKTGNFETAIDLQQQYLDICKRNDDRVGESAARGALAHAYEATGNTQEAIKQLENLLSVASEAGELKAQAGACLNLGILYNSRQNHEKSVELLEQHFDLARQIGDRRLIDSARVVLGMVRGNGKLKSYIDLVNNDLDKLLNWKSKRATLDA